MSATAAQKRFWSEVARLGCLVCSAPAEIAHAHSGSIVERMKEPKAKGKKLRRYNWLVLPLCPVHHRTGPEGEALDTNAVLWESRWGAQAVTIDLFCQRFGLDLWALANEGRK